MSLAKRLDRLREQAGVRGAKAAAEGGGAERASLRGRLARMQTRQRRFRGCPDAPPSDEDVAEVLGGEAVTSGLIEASETIPLTHSYGQQPLSVLAGSELWAGAGEEGVSPQRAIFLDTETTGLSGGTGTVAFLVGLGRVDAGALRLRQWLLTGFAGEVALLERVAALVAEAGVVVTYNGKAFDIPLLHTRARLAGVALELGERPQLDLLHTVRRRFGKEWPSCRLATTERELLGRERLDDLSGAEVPAAWLDFLQRGDPRRLPGVLAHNADDLRALAAIWAALDTARRGT